MDDHGMPLEQLFQRAKKLRVAGEYANAITLLSRFIRENPDHACAHMELGLAYCFNGQFDESIHLLEKAATLDQDNPEILLNLAKTYTMLGMYEEGRAAFEVVLDLTTNGDVHHEEARKQLSYFETTG